MGGILRRRGRAVAELPEPGDDLTVEVGALIDEGAVEVLAGVRRRRARRRVRDTPFVDVAVTVVVDTVATDLGLTRVDVGVRIVAVVVRDTPAVIVGVRAGSAAAAVDQRVVGLDQAETVLAVKARGTQVQRGRAQRLEHRRRRTGRAAGVQERRGARHVGRGHRGALVEEERPTGAVVGLLQDPIGHPVAIQVGAGVAARRHQIDAGAAVGVARHDLYRVDRSDRDGRGVRGRIADIVAVAVISRGAHDRDVVRQGVIQRRIEDRVVEDLCVRADSQAHVDDLGALVDGPVDALADVGQGAPAAVVEHLHRQDAGAVRQPGRADAVVAGLGDGAGHMGTMAVTIVDVGVVLNDVVAGENTADAVILTALTQAGVQHRDRDPGAIRHLPGGLHLNHGEIPLVNEIGVVDGSEGLHLQVERGLPPAGVSLDQPHLLGAGRHRHNAQIRARIVAENLVLAPESLRSAGDHHLAGTIAGLLGGPGRTRPPGPAGIAEQKRREDHADYYPDCITALS